MGMPLSKPPALSRHLRASVLGGDPTLEAVAKRIRDGRSKNVIVLAGAGISVSAGIPDFRTPGTGLYDNLEKYGLPTPQSIFDIEFFRENPRPFNHLARELYPGKFDPTLTHYFVRLLHEKGVLRRFYTQNIDMLERRAGIPHDKLVEAHGTFASSTCTRCGRKYDLPWMHARIVAPHLRAEAAATVSAVRGAPSASMGVMPDVNGASPFAWGTCTDDSEGASQSATPLSPVATAVVGSSPSSGPAPASITTDMTQDAIVPRCDSESCGGVVKPDIVFFGEGLPDRFWALQPEDMALCDLLIVMGTSLAVHPVAGIPRLVRPSVPRVLINRERVGEEDSDDDEDDDAGEGGRGDIAEEEAMEVIGPRALPRSRGFIFRSPKNYRDVWVPGETDAASTELARLLGWGDDLAALAGRHTAMLREERAVELAAALAMPSESDLVPVMREGLPRDTEPSAGTHMAPLSPAAAFETLEGGGSSGAAIDAAGLGVLQHALADLDLGERPVGRSGAGAINDAGGIAREVGLCS